MGSQFWTTVSESQFPWERDALDFVRERLPEREPFRAWSNFEFIADDGSINEVDLLVLSPVGLFLVEIKSQPGELRGDAGTWTWQKPDGKLVTTDNPLYLANQKAKKLASLLGRQKVVKRKRGRVPFIESLVFCSAPALRLQLEGTAAYRVCIRDGGEESEGPRPGIMAALERRECPGLDPHPKGGGDRETARLICQAMDQAGIRPSRRHRKVSDFELKQLLGEGKELGGRPAYQDWLATHVQLSQTRRRVRIYLVRTSANDDDRQMIQRAAMREAQLLETLEHPGILRIYGFTEHELGPALIFEHDPLSLRLDHFLAQRGAKLTPEARLELLRQIAEVVQYAHEKKIVHRALSPQNILVTNAGGRPRVKIFNWQAGYRGGTASSGVSREITATSHVDQLVDDISTAYMAPEAMSDGDNTGEHLDVFSLGCIAYHLFSGEAPAANGLELSNKLRETRGLQISSVLGGAGEALQSLVQESTHPEVPNRPESVARFLEDLDAVEAEVASPDVDHVDDPHHASKGDTFPGGYTVVRRIGEGSTSIAFLVERGEQNFILKVANDTDHNDRIHEEAEILGKLRHARIVELDSPVEIGSYAGFLMKPAFVERAKKKIETLGQRVRRDGRLHIDLLQRFGEDLLDVLNFLEEQGIPHRDIKPDNIAVAQAGRSNRLHALVFDFSLSRTPAENIRAGTKHYLDPTLPTRKPSPPRWDLHAERYAAAVTLYELATGTLPLWGDGITEPSQLPDSCEVTINPELFDSGLRESLTAFFEQALRRDPSERFDNAEEMQRAWRLSFEGVEEAGALTDVEDEDQLRELLADATFDTQIPELGLGTRATNALDRANILTVEDLLTFPMRRILRLRGVGNKTRREISLAIRILRERLGRPEQAGGVPQVSDEEAKDEDVDSLSVDLLIRRVTKASTRAGQAQQRVLEILLGLASDAQQAWATQSDVARCVEVTRARVGQIVGKLQERWRRDAAISRLREEIHEILVAAGGVLSAADLSEAVLAARGSVQDEPMRSQLAAAVTRAALEVERTTAEPRFLVRREGGRVIVATGQELAGYAFSLGRVADQLAAEDPLAAPARAMERLRAVPLPHEAEPLTDSRLLRLATAASETAAVSSRQEIYPRGMEATRALRLSYNALVGVKQLTVEEVLERVQGRYPDAAPLPGRPQLDDMLRAAGLELRWDPAADYRKHGRRGVGCYVGPRGSGFTVTSGSETLQRQPTTRGPLPAGELSPEEADARQFEERLQRAARDGAFLALLVHPRDYQQAVEEIARRFSVEVVDFEATFLEQLKAAAEKARVDWTLVLKTDAKPGSGDWRKLLMLVSRAVKQMEEQIRGSDRTVLLTYANLLGRYEQLDLLDRLRDALGRDGRLPGLWLLVPGDHQPLMDGKAIPVLSPAQRAQVPESWIRNVHRSRHLAAVGPE
ncbi:BREX system serine/threonine kinase PglW [Candidatus Laterigemmans baculatus]|uniref:BREX system serine/threonine kinase PglW n=1 Tax=Candidatus Laterigemmans baculatus TaxID=2770505 RepID=UPI0013DBD160|nr:BREX system serine/threonine kinase PglW [Candidatus Laterigemmans baculatus]